MVWSYMVRDIRLIIRKNFVFVGLLKLKNELLQEVVQLKLVEVSKDSLDKHLLKM